MSVRPLRLLIIGAHPDDADYSAGGLAALYAAAGHVVRMISLTNGDAGHHEMPGPGLANRRRAEAAASGAIIGAEYHLFDIHDGELTPSLENRKKVIHLIRSFDPDLILTHRPNDYHPDHRYTSQLVQDAAYMITVPAVVPGTKHLMKNPVIAYLPDDFRKPYPFHPTVAVDVGPVLSKIVDMLDCHVSQFYEWLPYNTGTLAKVPKEPADRKTWLAKQVTARLGQQADRYRALLVQCYGMEGRAIQYAEVFEPCEYGAPLDDEAMRHLFPFLPR